MLSIQKSTLDELDMGFVDSISKSETHFTNFVPSSEPSKIEVVKPKEEVPTPRIIRVDLKESKPKSPNLPKGKKHDKPLWVCHFCGKLGILAQTISSCKLLSKQLSKKYLCLKHKILWHLLVN